MKKLIVGVGIFVIIVVTIVTVKCDDIIYWYNHSLHEDEYVSIVPNNYFVEDNFLYVNNYDKSEIFNKRQLIDFIYYFINSLAESIKGYCNKEYTSVSSKHFRAHEKGRKIVSRNMLEKKN